MFYFFRRSIGGPTTPGIEMHDHFDPDGRWMGWSGWIRNEAGEVSGWHHHAANDKYVYVIRGSVTIEFGPGGAKRVEARAGDLLLVPSQAEPKARRRAGVIPGGAP